MDIFHIMFAVSTIAGIAAAIFQFYGKTKIAKILKIVAQGVDFAKPLLKDEHKAPGSKGNSSVTEFIASNAEQNGLLKDLDGFLKVNNINQKKE